MLTTEEISSILNIDVELVEKELEKLEKQSYVEKIELDKELQEATQDDQDDPSVWEQK